MPTPSLIFDFDGLVADTEYAIYLAWRDLYLSQGHDLPLETYVQCVGSTFHSYDPITALNELLGYEPEWPILLQKKDDFIRMEQKNLDTLPGVRSILESCRTHDVRTALASSSSSDHINYWLDKLEIRHHFDVICTRNDVTHAKPAPDLFLLALERLNVSAQDALVLEDSHNGLRAARAANVHCIIVPNRITQHSDFTQAAAILPSLENHSPLSLFELLS